MIFKINHYHEFCGCYCPKDKRLSFCAKEVEQLFGMVDFDLEISETPIEGGFEVSANPDDYLNLVINHQPYRLMPVNFWLLKQLPSTFWIKAHALHDTPECQLSESANGASDSNIRSHA